MRYIYINFQLNLLGSSIVKKNYLINLTKLMRRTKIKALSNNLLDADIHNTLNDSRKYRNGM